MKTAGDLPGQPVTGMLPGGGDREREPLWRHPRPHEIATRQFSRTLWGANPREVRRQLLEFAAALDRSRAAHSREILQHRDLERSLEDASRAVRELQQQLRTAKAELMIMETASTAALEVLRSARQVAQTIRRSIDVVSAAGTRGDASSRNS